MLNEHKDQLIVSLTAAIEEWLEKTDDIPRPWLGYNCSQIMAQAAMIIMVAIEDAQIYLKDQGLMTDDA